MWLRVRGSGVQPPCPGLHLACWSDRLPVWQHAGRSHVRSHALGIVARRSENSRSGRRLAADNHDARAISLGPCRTRTRCHSFVGFDSPPAGCGPVTDRAKLEKSVIPYRPENISLLRLIPQIAFRAVGKPSAPNTSTSAATANAITPRRHHWRLSSTRS